MKYWTADKGTGNYIEAFDTIKDALKAIEIYEDEDRRNGDYTDDFYDVVDDNHCSVM